MHDTPQVWVLMSKYMSAIPHRFVVRYPTRALAELIRNNQQKSLGLRMIVMKAQRRVRGWDSLPCPSMVHVGCRSGCPVARSQGRRRLELLIELEYDCNFFFWPSRSYFTKQSEQLQLLLNLVRLSSTACDWIQERVVHQPFL